MDAIAIRGIRAWGSHGANAGERAAPQPFEIDVTLETDLSGAARSDDLADTVDYASVCERVRAVVSETSFALLERLAAAILEGLFGDARIARAQVRIAKPNLLDGATPSVELSRNNPNFQAHS